MRHESATGGGFAVAAMDSLPPSEATVVACLRLWAAPDAGPEAVWRALSRAMGAAHGAACHRALADLMEMLHRHGRRPIVRHDAGCGCVGADEAVLAHFVTTAATGEREDAILIASLLVRGPMILPFAELGRQAGLLLHRAALRRPDAIPEPASATRH